MTQTHFIITIFAFLVTVAFACTKSDQASQPESSILPPEGITISEPWARPGRANGMSAAYMLISNGSAQADTLIGASSNVSAMTEIHESFERDGGMMGMRHAEYVVIPPQSTIRLQPGGLHVMLMQLNEALTVGDELELTLQFSNSGEKVQKLNVQSP